MEATDLLAHGASQQLVDALSSTGLSALYPPQVRAIEAGLLQNRDSFVVAAPTASGKTLIAEMAGLKIFFEKAGKIIYTLPLKALAREKYEDLSRKYAKIGLRVEQTTGDLDRADPWLAKADLIVSTNEKMDSLMRHRAAWLADVNLVVADEVHLIGDGHRGPTLEVLLTRLKHSLPRVRIIALSATIPNSAEIAHWLGARLVSSDWRPVPLREGVYLDGAVIFNDGTVSWIPRESGTDAIDVVLGTVREGGQCLLFVNSRKAAEAAAVRAAGRIGALLTDADRKDLQEIGDRFLKTPGEPSKLAKKAGSLVSRGVAFHHAGLASSDRRLIEDAFRRNRIKLLASTTTLAMGLNLPSRRVVIRDWRRYEQGEGMRPIPVMEIKQMAGRAGRPGLDPYGEAVLMAGNKRDERILFERYIKGEPETVTSRLGSEAVLRMHILAFIAGGLTRSRTDLMALLGQTFFAHRSGIGSLAVPADHILEFLLVEELIREREILSATGFGRRVSELYVDPLTAVIIRDGLGSGRVIKAFGLLHLAARTPDMIRLPLRESEIDDMLRVFSLFSGDLLVPEKAVPTEETLAEIKTAALLTEWIGETPEETIAEKFTIGPGDLHTVVETANWLLYSSSEIARLFKREEARSALVPLRQRVLYGVREELLPLVSLRGIGRIRARNLFQAGFRSLGDIREAGVQEIEKVPAIGTVLARDIKNQVAPNAAA